jgi:hypothetical protein
MRAVAAGGARPDEVDVGGRLLLLLGGGDGRRGGEVVLHGAHVVEAAAPCHDRSRSVEISLLSPPLSFLLQDKDLSSCENEEEEKEGRSRSKASPCPRRLATTLCSSPPYGLKAKAADPRRNDRLHYVRKRDRGNKAAG